MTVIDQAKSIANMVSLGVDVGSVVELASTWEMNADLRVQRRAFKEVLIKNQHDIGIRPGLYLSWHYGMYSGIVYKLAEQNALKSVCVLIGEQSDSHANWLKSLAAEVGFTVEFLGMGSRSLRRARELIRCGQSVFMLIDMPWSHDNRPRDIKYVGNNGSFLGYRELERLANLIDKEYRFIYLNHNGKIIEKPAINFESIFEIISSNLFKNPELYEKLHVLDMYYEFKLIVNTSVIFKINDELFIYFTKSNSVYQICSKIKINNFFDNNSICNNEKFCNFISDYTGEIIDLLIII
jgi:hypothetical protein